MNDFASLLDLLWNSEENKLLMCTVIVCLVFTASAKWRVELRAKIGLYRNICFGVPLDWVTPSKMPYTGTEIVMYKQRSIRICARIFDEFVIDRVSYQRSTWLWYFLCIHHIKYKKKSDFILSHRELVSKHDQVLFLCDFGVPVPFIALMLTLK